ncbi:MAG: DUF2029 domain-containing protein [Anaerolineae bacterium]|nr:DUF2029 domain-containing protein [Anaerolineae bacterium]
MNRGCFLLYATLILLLAAGLRFHALGQDARFHQDEALFASFARRAAVQGDWLLTGALDKTPLSIYLQAISFSAVGVTPLPDGVLTLGVHQGEFAARLPAIFASILLVAVISRVARGQGSGVRGKPQAAIRNPLVALFIAACSPLLIAFSPTAFTDMPFLLLLTVSLWLTLRGKPLWAGVWLALAFAAKQQAVLYVPLLIAISYQRLAISQKAKGERTAADAINRVPTGESSSIVRHGLLLVLPLALMLLLLLGWDALRNSPPGLFALATANNAPDRFPRPDELLPRLQTWWAYADMLIGWPFVLVAGFILIWLVTLRRTVTRVDGVLAGYTALYLLAHWLLPFNTYDRYLLPLVPLVISLLARSVQEIGKAYAVLIYSGRIYGRRRPNPPLRPHLATTYVLIGLTLLPAAWSAARLHVAVGGDRGQLAGIDALADWLEAKPLGTIIYDRWLGWGLEYYRGSWSDKRMVYYPTPGELARGAAAQPDPAPRYFPMPVEVSAEGWLQALREAGFSINRAYESARFIVYELIPP